MAAELAMFRQAEVAKVFPDYDEEPFPGTVSKVDTTGSDDKPFFITYDDGDREWVTLEELATILVDPQLAQQAQFFLEHGVEGDDDAGAADANGHAAPGSKKRGGGAAPSGGNSKKRKSQGAAAAAAAEPEPVSHPAARSRGKAQQQAPAAAAAAGSGVSGGRQQAKGAGRLAAAAAGGADSDAVSPEEFDGLVRDVVQAAPKHADQLQSDSFMLRLPYKGPGASTLPIMSQAVVCGNEALFTIYGASRSGSRPTNYMAYYAETQDALNKLQDQMGRLQGRRLTKQLLTRVRVHLHSVQDGLDGFRDAWNAWVEPHSAPVLTILEGTGPLPSGGVVLEASVYAGPSDH